MRPVALATMVVLVCGCSPTVNAPAPQQSSLAPSTSVDPARIVRVRAALPPGYEAGTADGVGSPTQFWGLRGDWSADPPDCAALLPRGDPSASRGVSGSGAGGTVYVVVTTGAPAPDPALTAACGQWTVSGAHSAATVSAADPPQIADAVTVGMTAALHTVVESGTVTETVAHTYAAYLGAHTVFVTVVVDPGASGPALQPQFGADLLAASVAELRG